MASSTRLRASAVCMAEGRVLLVRMRDALWVPEDDAPRRMAPVIAEAVTRVIGRARTA